MPPEWLWRGGRLWTAVVIGVPGALFFGTGLFAEVGSAGSAVFGGVLFGVLLGGSMTVLLARTWKESAALRPADRVSVARAVRRGEDIGDRGLAEAVLSYCEAFRRNRARDVRFRGALRFFIVFLLFSAVLQTFSGSLRSAVVGWALVAWWLFFRTWVPRRMARLGANADKAEAFARSRLTRP